jgi:large subunit ribosomal protein L4
MRVDILNTSGQPTGRSIELPDNIFGVTPNEHVIYLAVKQYLAAQRQGTHKTKEKWEVSRTTKKFKRQKGTGGARAGSLKSPLWRGGGTVFGPQPRSYDFSLNKKVKRLARYSALSIKAAQGSLKVVEDFDFDQPKTKDFVDILKNLGVDSKKSVVVIGEGQRNVYLSGRNFPKTLVRKPDGINTYDLMNAQDLVLLESSISKIS